MQRPLCNTPEHIMHADRDLLAPFAALKPAKLFVHIVWASPPSNVDFPLSQESRNGSWPGTEPGVVARSTHNAPIYRHSTECDSDDVCKLAREV